MKKQLPEKWMIRLGNEENRNKFKSYYQDNNIDMGNLSINSNSRFYTVKDGNLYIEWSSHKRNFSTEGHTAITFEDWLESTKEQQEVNIDNYSIFN